MDWTILDNRPIWLQLEEQLTMRILSGLYPKGSWLPTVRELASEAGVNPNTMQRAFSALEGSGLVVTHRTAGRQVTEDDETLRTVRNQIAAQVVQNYLRDMQTLGFSETEAREKMKEGTEWNRI